MAKPKNITFRFRAERGEERYAEVLAERASKSGTTANDLARDTLFRALDGETDQSNVLEELAALRADVRRLETLIVRSFGGLLAAHAGLLAEGDEALSEERIQALVQDLRQSVS